ncbi:MAG: hypothetical protein JXB47_20835 [Anaerolineae bacterium]|nr:hypothetical protein [Anaerolineae bacterium]
MLRKLVFVVVLLPLLVIGPVTLGQESGDECDLSKWKWFFLQYFDLTYLADAAATPDTLPPILLEMHRVRYDVMKSMMVEGDTVATGCALMLYSATWNWMTTTEHKYMALLPNGRITMDLVLIDDYYSSIEDEYAKHGGKLSALLPLLSIESD